MQFAKFMASGTGRAIRAIAGAALLFYGLSMGTTIGYAIAAFGAVAVASGLFNFCLIAPILRAPFWGKDVK